MYLRGWDCKAICRVSGPTEYCQGKTHIITITSVIYNISAHYAGFRSRVRERKKRNLRHHILMTNYSWLMLLGSVYWIQNRWKNCYITSILGYCNTLPWLIVLILHYNMMERSKYRLIVGKYSIVTIVW